MNNVLAFTPRQPINVPLAKPEQIRNRDFQNSWHMGMFIGLTNSIKDGMFNPENPEQATYVFRRMVEIANEYARKTDPKVTA